jgi:sporulation protein YlmC with PRC-barrel domain
MRRTLLATASAAVLAIAGAALAQQAVPGAQPNPYMMPNVGAADTSTGAPRATSMSPGGSASGANLPQTTTGMMADQPMGEAAARILHDDRPYRSWEQMGGAATGRVLGELPANEVEGKRVIDRNGETLGRIVDLLVADDGTVDRAMIELADGRHVPVMLDELRLPQGDADDELVLNWSQYDIGRASVYERQGDRWVPRTGS